MAPKSFTLPDQEILTFTWRPDNNTDRADATEVELKIDLTGLTEADILEWAFSSMIVSFQSKLRSKKLPVLAKDDKGKDIPNSYEWKVPARGSRSVADPKHLEEKAGKLLQKMDPETKFHVLVAAGLSAEMATQATGFTPPKANRK